MARDYSKVIEEVQENKEEYIHDLNLLLRRRNEIWDSGEFFKVSKFYLGIFYSYIMWLNSKGLITITGDTWDNYIEFRINKEAIQKEILKLTEKP